MTPGKLVNALKRLETPGYDLRRCVSGASRQIVFLGTVERSFISKDGPKDGAPCAQLRRSGFSNNVLKTAINKD